MTDVPESDGNIAKRSPQYLASFIASLSGFAISISKSPLVLNPSHSLVETQEELQNILHLNFIGQIVGIIISGYVNQKLGPKRAIQVTAFPLFMSRLVTAYCRTIYGFYAAILLNGLSTGIILYSGLNYLMDIAEYGRRGSVAFMFFFMESLGQFCAILMLENINDFILQALIPSVVPVIYLTALSFMPESPVFMCMQEDLPQASSNLQWLRGPDYNIDEEIAHIQKRTRMRTKNNHNEGETNPPSSVTLSPPSLRQTAVTLCIAMAMIVCLYFMVAIQDIMIIVREFIYLAPIAEILTQITLMILIDRINHLKLMKVMFTWTAIDTLLEQVCGLTMEPFKDYGLTHLFNELTAHAGFQIAVILLWQLLDDIPSRNKTIPLCFLLWQLMKILMNVNSNLNFHWVYITALGYLIGYLIIKYFLQPALNKTPQESSTVHVENKESV